MRRLLCLTLLAIAAMAFGSGCMSYSTLHTAKPVKEGATQITIAPSYYGIAQSVGSGTLSGDIPSAEIAGRHGLTKDMGVGVKLFPIGAAFDLNYALVNEPGFVLSADPYVSVVRISSNSTDSNGEDTTSSFTYGVAMLNVLADVVSTDAISVTLGLKPGFLYAVGTSGSSSDAATGGVIGAMAGLTFRLNEKFAIMPTLDILMPFSNFGDTIFYNGALAVQF